MSSHEEFFENREIKNKDTTLIDEVGFVEADKCLGIAFIYGKKKFVKGYDQEALSEFIDLLVTQLSRMQNACEH